jgi:hypothetical protein
VRRVRVTKEGPYSEKKKSTRNHKGSTGELKSMEKKKGNGIN